MYSDLADEIGIIRNSAGALVCRVQAIRYPSVKIAGRSVQLTCREEFRVAMVKTAKRKINFARTIDSRWSHVSSVGICNQLHSSVVERVVSFTCGGDRLHPRIRRIVGSFGNVEWLVTAHHQAVGKGEHGKWDYQRE